MIRGYDPDDELVFSMKGRDGVCTGIFGMAYLLSPLEVYLKNFDSRQKPN